MTQEAITIASVVTEVGAFFTEGVSWMGEAVSFIGSNPIPMLMVVCMPVAGWAIGGLKRLLRL